MGTPEIHDLFPTPVMRFPRALDGELVAGLVKHFTAAADRPNNSSANLSHTAMLRPSDSPLLVEAAIRITPLVGEFGRLLFGELLGWSLKEMWVNLLDPGGHQAMHNHANSFISGVAYLTATHGDARTVFMKSPGGHDFAFKNDHVGVKTGRYNAEKWISPEPTLGDVILFPSFLLHSVPPNPGPLRITMAFNAIPARLESWGYGISFAG